MLLILILPIIITSKLIGVIELNRHGARTPKDFIDISKELFYRSSSSHLTLNGFTQVTFLGKWLKERYTNEYELLSNTYNTNEALFISSPISRSIFSAVGILEAMYPGEVVIPQWEGNTELRNNDLPPIKDIAFNTTKHIVLNVKDQEEDKLFHTDSCRLEKDGPRIKDIIVDDVILNITDIEIKNTIDDISKKAPEVFGQIRKEYNIDVIIHLCGFFLPVNYHYNNGNYYELKKETLEVLRKGQINKMYMKRMDESNLGRLIISPLFFEFRKYLTKFGKDDLKFILFSGHDTNIADILVNIMDKEFIRKNFKTEDENFNFIMPPFASTMLFELHTNLKNNLKSQKFVRILYNGETIKTGFNKMIKYDDSLDGIPLKNFIYFLSAYIDPGFNNLYCHNSADEAEILETTNLLNR
jgi:hypothetical protein